MRKNSPIDTSSPFHRGEQLIQSHLGVRNEIENLGKRIIRNYMPHQHREFYQRLPFVLVGYSDRQGWPWASILFNAPGFISSSSDTQLNVNALPVTGDPLNKSLELGLKMGLLGIELQTRRRNRLTAEVQAVSSEGFILGIDQCFGNCPQYIQLREKEQVLEKPSIQVQKLFSLDNTAQSLISNADTFFVASAHNDNSGAKSNGADVSHRGGKPGFIRIDDEGSLTIPDYYGNFLFNTLGNFVENPKAGLLFIDFEYGHLLSLTGQVEILWNSTETKYFQGAERLWRFQMNHGWYIRNALPFSWKMLGYAPTTLRTGTWNNMVQDKGHNQKNIK